MILNKFVFGVFLCFSRAGCSNFFNTEDVTVITDSSVESTYFSYSLLLQRGAQSSVIVGAPKQKKTEDGGSLYKCDLSGSNPCTKYNIRPASTGSFNGNFLGVSLDGDDVSGGPFVVCAPRMTFKYNSRGQCFWKRNSSSLDAYVDTIDPVANEQPISSGPGGAYYNFAFSEVGFDVSYVKEKNEILMGAPGVKSWTGILITWNLRDSSRGILPHESYPLQEYLDSYRGYKVATGKFVKGRSFYIIGAPRASVLKGKVIIFGYDVAAPDKTVNWATLVGQYTGSGFGSTLLASDVTGDGIDDLLVGAPTAKGATYDEGYAEFYRVGPRGKFESGIKLYGQSKTGARFGSAMTLLGDINLDGYNDVAISAPYEDDGTGAVYIYNGDYNGLSTKYSQRLSPLDLNIKISVRGFGLGLSKGNDIDGNGYNDLAIGAYQTSQLFIFKTKPIFDYYLKLQPNVTTINTNTTAFKITYCLKYSARYKGSKQDFMVFRFEVQLDYRSKLERNYTDNVEVKMGIERCMQHDVLLKPYVQDISPFKISVAVVSNETRVSETQTQIPYAHGCGDDNICNTDLVVSSFSSITEVVPGQTKEIPLTVSVENLGEPAYQTELHIKFSKFLELRNIRDCTKKLDTYICPFDERLTQKKEKEFIFDINLENLAESESKNVSLYFAVKSLGENQGNNNKTILSIPVTSKSSPFILGKSDPETFQYIQYDTVKDLKMKHLFSVGNLGPSPVKLDVNILVPKVQVGGQNIFEILEAKMKFDVSSLGALEMQCFPTNDISDNSLNKENETIPLPMVPVNRTAVISCYDGVSECQEYVCRGEYYLYKSSQDVVYEMSVTAKVNLLGEKVKDFLKESKDIIAFVSSAYLQNSTHRIEAFSTTIIFVSSVSEVPIWIYIVGTILGLILLLVIIFVLYKCHFFDRIYKDKLNEEKLLDQGTVSGSMSTIGAAKSDTEELELPFNDVDLSSEK